MADTIQQALNTSDLSPMSKRALGRALKAAQGESEDVQVLQQQVSFLISAVQVLADKLDADDGVTDTDYRDAVDVELGS